MSVFPPIHLDRIPPGSFQQPVPLPAALPGDPPLVQICINQDWLPYVLGCLFQLTMNTTWIASTPSELQTALQRANDLILIFQKALPGCTISTVGQAGAEDGFMLRQNPANPCELQTSVDGVTWCTWADLSKCLPLVTQPGAGTPQPAPGGGCQTYHAILDANGKWLLPAPVNSGDTITVTNAKGATNDGTVSPWNCPDGSTFFAGACIGGGGTSGGDPDPSVNHMALLGHVGSLFFPVLGGPVTLPGGIAFGQLTFQVNDAILSDNLGSIEFDVQVCNEQAATWSHTFDFRTTDGGFVAYQPSFLSSAPGHWVAGQGWRDDQYNNNPANTGFRGLSIHRTGVPAFALTKSEVVWTLTKGTVTNPAATDALIVAINNYSAQQSVQFMAGVANGVNDITSVTPEAAVTEVDIYLACGDQAPAGTDPGGTVFLTQLTISGSGTDPF